MIFSLRKQGPPCQTFSSKPELTSAVSLRKQGPCALCRHCLHNEWPLVPWNPQASPMIGGQERISVHEKKTVHEKRPYLKKYVFLKNMTYPVEVIRQTKPKKETKQSQSQNLTILQPQ